MAARKSAKSTKGLADADAAEAYNPLARINIARSIAGELLARRAIPLSDSDGIVGAGIYALYYCGDFPAYAPARNAPERLLDYLLQRMTPAQYDIEPYLALQNYVTTGDAWTGSDAQLNTKASGLARLIAGSGEYQFV